MRFMMSRSVPQFANRFVATLLVAVLATSPMLGCSLSSDQDSGFDNNALSGVTLLDQVKKSCRGWVENYLARPATAWTMTATERLLKLRLCEQGADIAYQSAKRNEQPNAEAVSAFQQMLEWSSQTNKLSASFVSDASRKETQALVATAAHNGLFEKNLSWRDWELLQKVKTGQEPGGIRRFLAETGTVETARENPDTSATEVAAARSALISAEVAGLGLVAWRALAIIALIGLLAVACSQPLPLTPSDQELVSTPIPTLGTAPRLFFDIEPGANLTSIFSAPLPDGRGGFGLQFARNVAGGGPWGLGQDVTQIYAVLTLGSFQFRYETGSWYYDLAGDQVDAQYVGQTGFYVYEGTQDPHTSVFTPHTQLVKVALTTASTPNPTYNVSQLFGVQDMGVLQKLVRDASDCSQIMDYLAAAALNAGERQTPYITLPDGTTAAFVTLPVCADYDEVEIAMPNVALPPGHSGATCFELVPIAPGQDGTEAVHVGLANVAGDLGSGQALTTDQTAARLLDGARGQAATVSVGKADNFDDSSYAVCVPPGADLNSYVVTADRNAMSYSHVPGSCEGGVPGGIGGDCRTLADYADLAGDVVTIIRLGAMLFGAGG